MDEPRFASDPNFPTKFELLLALFREMSYLYRYILLSEMEKDNGGIP